MGIVIWEIDNVCSRWCISTSVLCHFGHYPLRSFYYQGRSGCPVRSFF